MTASAILWTLVICLFGANADLRRVALIARRHRHLKPPQSTSG